MQDIYSFMFLLVCALCTFLGIYILLSNTRSGLNILFWIMCCCMALWSFGFSVAINAPSQSICLIGRRIAAGGWALIISFIVHFILILTGEKPILSKRWVYPLLYAPAAASLYVFSLSNYMAPVQYNLVLTRYGWTNLAVSNGWGIFYYAYCISFFLIAFYFFWRWGRRAQDDVTKRQARMLLGGWIAAIVIGSLDIFFNTIVPGAHLPQMAPIAFSIPLLMISLFIRKYQYLRVESLADSDIILASRTQSTTYNYLSFAFIAGGFLYYATQYIMQDGNTLKEVLLPSALLFLTGVLIQIVIRFKFRQRMMESIYIVAVVVSIPAIMLNLLDLGSETVWAYPFILLIFAMLFRRSLVLACTTVVLFLSQVLVWYLRPSVTVQVNADDYGGRIGLLAIGVWVAFFVHKAYVLRIKENERQIEGQKLIADISAEMVSVDLNNQNEKIGVFLSMIGKHYHADSVRLVPRATGNENLPEDSLWMSEVDCQKPMGHLPFCVQAAYTTEDCPAPETSAGGTPIPEPAGAHGEVASLCIPMSMNGEVFAHIQIESVKGANMWKEDQIQRLRILSNILADTLERVRAENEAHFLAYYDHLTNLPNRSLLLDRLQQAINVAQRSEKTLGVVFLDLDGFKSINDTIGHQGGDALIREVAQQLVKCLRKTDTVARFGGDEFVIVVNQLNHPEDIIKVMDAIMGMFRSPFIVAGQEMFITASTGVALYPLDGADTYSLVKSADIAMYHAKEKGKNQYVLCSSPMREDVHKKMHLTNGLYRVLERQELEVYYQPQVDLQTKKIVGMEALLRWHHPEFGLVSPGIFIPLAEQTGLINPIGEWVLLTACQQNKAWQQLGLPHLRVAVNISVNQFRNPKLTEQVHRILEKTELDPEYLELEITESVAIREDDYIVTVLNALKRLNVQISIDDFGTGYSSLSRLKLLPVDRLKMDIQFVREIENSDKDRAISKVIINLAKSLGMKVIAEGVETEGQMNFLSQKMCDEVQGYYYYKPMPASEVEALLRREPSN